MNALSPIIRVFAFVRKELFGALRQPRLVLSLVLGPFLILALFGLGFQGSGSYTTILVVPDRAGVSTKLSDYNQVLQGTFNLIGVTKDQKTAMNQLNNGDTQVVIVVPATALDDIYNGKNAKFPVYYRDLNPTQSNYIEFSTYVYATEFDHIILEQALATSKPSQSQFQAYINQMNNSTNQLQNDMRTGNAVDAKIQIQEMQTITQLAQGTVNSVVVPGNGSSSNAQANLLGGEVSNTILQNGLGATKNDLSNINSKLNAISSGLNSGDLNSAQQQSNLASVRQSNQDLTQRVNKIEAIPPEVMVTPVLADAHDLASTTPSYINFYGPAVIILLLQHIGITLSSLSNVRDRLIGAIEVFRVAPISPFQILTGKFISFAVLLLGLGALLIVLITQVLGVPFINFDSNWILALATLAVTIYASIGLGFLVAGLSRTESQAVQLSMIILLSSIFFTGFVVPLNNFAHFITYVSYFLPMTFGAENLQRVMLDNHGLDWFSLLVPLAIGTLYLLIGRFLYRRQFNIG